MVQADSLLTDYPKQQEAYNCITLIRMLKYSDNGQEKNNGCVMT